MKSITDVAKDAQAERQRAYFPEVVLSIEARLAKLEAKVFPPELESYEFPDVTLPAAQMLLEVFKEKAPTFYNATITPESSDLYKLMVCFVKEPKS